MRVTAIASVLLVTTCASCDRSAPTKAEAKASPAASTSPSIAASSSAAPEAALAPPADEEQEPDDAYADAVGGDDAELPDETTIAVTSPFPYACDDCAEAVKPTSKIVDAHLVAAVRDYACDAGTDHHFVPFFPGIQGKNDGRVRGLVTRLGGDAATANLYVKYAQLSTREAEPTTGRWSLLFYYNVPSANQADPTGPIWLAPQGGPGEKGVHLYARANHSSLRIKRHGKKAREGDQVEARLLGVWATTPDDADFEAATPVFGATGDMRDRDALDFARFRGEVASAPAFRDFMRRSAYEVAIAFKCGTPVMAHSGGGAVVAFVSRLLAVSPLGADMRTWSRPFHVVGLEAVLTAEAKKRLNEELGHVAIDEFVVGESGSKTYAELITREETECGYTPLPPTPVLGNVNPPGWNGDAGGHGGLGFFALLHGRLPDRPPFAGG